MAQMLSLSQSELENLALFMGHSVDVHLLHYRMPKRAYEVARLSKLFVAMESGTVAQQERKRIAELEGPENGNESMSQ